MKELVLTLFVGISVFGFASDAQWRGKNRDGHYDGGSLLTKWPESGPTLLWSMEELDPGYSSPSVTGSIVYVTGSRDKMEYLYAIDNKGKILWKNEMGASFEGDFSLARCTPTVKDGRVYVLSGAGKISCIDAGDGKLVWSLDAYQQFGGSYGLWGVAENLLIEGNKLFYTPGGDKTTMVALNAETGAVIWKSKSLKDKSAYSSPIAFDHAGRRVIANVTAQFIFGVDAESGELLWHYNYGTLDAPPVAWGAPYVNSNTPIYNDGHIYVTSGYDHVGAMFKLAENGRGISVAWTDKTLDTHHGGVVLVDGYIYGANWINNRSGNWCSIDWKTGKAAYETKWKTKGSISSAGGMLYCYEERGGHLALVKATPKSFEVISSLKVELGSGPHWSHPVIDDGILYLRHGKSLSAYDIRAK